MKSVDKLGQSEKTRYAERDAELRQMRIIATGLLIFMVLLFVAGWTRRGQPQTQALFPCVQNLLLACRAVGLGASLGHVPWDDTCRRSAGCCALGHAVRSGLGRVAARQHSGARGRHFNLCALSERMSRPTSAASTLARYSCTS